MNSRRGSSSPPLSSTATWSLIVISILSCCAALVFSEKREPKRWQPAPGAAAWPPPAEFFKGSPIGLAYYLQKWFRFGLMALNVMDHSTGGGGGGGNPPIRTN